MIQPSSRRGSAALALALILIATITVADASTAGAGSQPPTFSKAFMPDVIVAGEVSTLTFSIAATLPVGNLAFTDELPADVVIATPSGASTDCNGGTLTATAGGTTVTYSGGAVLANTTCTVSVDVTSSIAGNYTNTSGALTSSECCTGTATDDLTVAVAISPGAAAVVEGGEGSSVIVNVPVTLSNSSATTVTVEWETFGTGAVSGIATEGVDYEAAAGTVIFPPGETTQTVPITVIGDNTDEPPAGFGGEWGLVAFSNPSAGATIDPSLFFGFGIFIIVDDDPPPVISPGAAAVMERDEGSTVVVNVPVTLSNPSATPVTIEWETFGTGAVSGIATEGVDYEAAAGTVIFAPGETTQSVPVTVIGDDIEEEPAGFGGEWGLVAFSNPSAGSTIDPSLFFGFGIFVIVDDDPRPQGCRIDGTLVPTDLSQAECDALVALYHATDGPSWGDEDGWNTTTDPCGWGGVRCTEGSVTRLFLDEKGLFGPLPPEIADLTSLTGLFLEENSVLSLPPEIGELTNLVHIRLFGSRLTSLPPEIGNLTNLISLDVLDNQLASLPPEIGNLTNLDQLTVGLNRLTSVPSEIGNLTNLTSLDLSGNQLVSVPSELGNLTNLTSLGLSGNQLVSVPSELGNLTNLTRLGLSENELVSVPSELGNLTNLTHLFLGENQLVSVPPVISNLTNLSRLELRFNELVGDITGPFLPHTGRQVVLSLSDGIGVGNGCLTVTDAALQAWLDLRDPNWNEECV